MRRKLFSKSISPQATRSSFHEEQRIFCLGMNTIKETD
jgi:hypothetical protein